VVVMGIEVRIITVTVNANSQRATPDTMQSGLFCRVWYGGVNRVGSTARQVRGGD